MLEKMHKVEAEKRGVSVYYHTGDMQAPHSKPGWYYTIKYITVQGPFPSEESCWQAAICAGCIVEPPGQAVYAAKVFQRIVHRGILKSSGVCGRLTEWLRQEVREIDSQQYQIWGIWQRVSSSEEPEPEIIMAQNYFQHPHLRMRRNMRSAIAQASFYHGNDYYR